MVVCKCFHVAIRGGEVTISFQYSEMQRQVRPKPEVKRGNNIFSFVSIELR